MLGFASAYLSEHPEAVESRLPVPGTGKVHTITVEMFLSKLHIKK